MFLINITTILLFLCWICQIEGLNSCTNSMKIVDVNLNQTKPRIENFAASIVTKHNAILTWNIENFDDLDREKYQVSISYKSACNFRLKTLNIDDQVVRIGNESNQFIYAFENLCPNNLNKITLHINSSLDNVTIPDNNVVFTASPIEPYFSPIIDRGSFFIDDIGDLFIYWKRINPTDYNGDIFEIQITNEHLQEPNNNHENYKAIWIPKFGTNLFNASLGSKIKLLSSNIVGPAAKASYLEIPSKDRLCGKPENIQVRLGDDYHVSWTKPIGDYNITSYTVFWCTSVSNSSANCDAPINFETVTGSLQFSLKSSDRQLKFAVSANTVNSTSGMTWMECLAETDSTQIGRIESNSKIITISTNQIKLEWTPKCEDRFIAKNYEVFYCKVDEHISDCIDSIMIISTNSTTYTFENLKSSTLYKFTILMQSETTNGLPSIPQYIKTHITYSEMHMKVFTCFLLMTTLIALIVMCLVIRKFQILKSWLPSRLEDTDSSIV